MDKLQEVASDKLFEKYNKTGAQDKNRHNSKLNQKTKKNNPRVGQEEIIDIPNSNNDLFSNGLKYSGQILLLIGVLFGIFYIFARYLLGFNMNNNYVIIQESMLRSV